MIAGDQGRLMASGLVRFVALILLSWLTLYGIAFWGQSYLTQHSAQESGTQLQTLQAATKDLDSNIQRTALVLLFSEESEKEVRDAARRLLASKPEVTIRRTDLVQSRKSTETWRDHAVALRSPEGFYKAAEQAFFEALWILLSVQSLFLLAMGLMYIGRFLLPSVVLQGVVWIALALSTLLLVDALPYLDPNEIPGAIFGLSAQSAPLLKWLIAVVFPLSFGAVFLSGALQSLRETQPEQELLHYKYQQQEAWLDLFRISCARNAGRYRFAIPYFVMALLFVQAKVTIAHVDSRTTPLSRLVESAFGTRVVEQIINNILLVAVILLLTLIGRQFFGLLEETLLSRIDEDQVR